MGGRTGSALGRQWSEKVSEGVKAAVATGENLHDISEFRPLLEAGAVDVVQVGAGTSGITGALMIGELAYAFDKPVSVMNCSLLISWLM